jgi:matrixin
MTAAIAAAIVTIAANASAFCRSTTCRSTPDKECPTDDDECPTAGAKLFWPTSCLQYATNKLGTQDLDPADTRDIIRKTFEAWNDVPCPAGGHASMHIEERDPVSCKKSQYNKTGPNVNVVLFQDDDWKYRGVDATLAKTSVTYNDETGEIYDADIEINTANNTVTISDDPQKVKYDLQAILTHEVGHFIGIAHSPNPSAVMFASYSPGSMTQRKLDPDDVDAVCAVYPPESGVACQAEPRGGFEGSCDDPPESKAICSVGAVGNNTDFRFSGGFLGVLVGSAFLTAARVRGHRGRSDALRDTRKGGRRK